MKTSRSIAALVALTFLLIFPVGSDALSVQDQPPAILARLLDQAGYPYTKVKENIWAIPFEGKKLPQFNLGATTQQDVAVLFVVVAEKADFRLSPELMLKLLQLNAALDRVKVFVDDDGDASVRVDLSVRRLDVEELKVNIEQVAASADKVYEAIKPFQTGKK